MKLIYICISLCPGFLRELKGKANQISLSFNIDTETLLRDIAKDAYREEVFNLGDHPRTNEKLRPPFGAFLEGLEKQVSTYEYDAVVYRVRTPSQSDVSRQEQKEYMEGRLQEL